MKSFLFLLLVLIGFTIPIITNAQNSNEKTPKWLSDKGYWVVESNKKTPKTATVFFYTNDHQLLHKETITGKKIRLNRKKILIEFKTALETSFARLEKGDTLNKQPLLAHLFR